MAEINRENKVTDRQSMARSGTAGGQMSHLERTAPRGYVYQSWLRFRRNKTAMGALIVTILILLFSFGAPLISMFVTGKGYQEQSLMDQLHPPFTEGYILGSDNLGRDVLTRLAYGGRVSTTVAFTAMFGALAIGGVLGSIAGYYGRWIDSVIMRFVDILLSVPSLFLLVFIGSIFTMSPIGLALVIAIVGWLGLARLIRGEVMSIKQRDYVEAAKVVGASDSRIISRHIFPNVIPLVIVWATLAVPVLIIVEASLSYLGLGVQTPIPSWGNMLRDAQRFISHQWTLVFIPGAMIYVTVLAINLLGNGLRDALDPRLSD
ncbi:MAG: ABC transporter permease [Sphaerobacteraceae bacterium]|nr:MAG: ABC transporter permease [Sphaerobacteraceae bacterium]